MDFKIAIVFSSWILLNAKAKHQMEFGSYGVFRNEPYFNDKTEMLNILFNDSSPKVADKPYYFVTCPYNFGKTTNLLMIKQFAEIELDGNRKPKHWLQTYALDVFRHLKINQHANLLIEHMARYPVIYMDLRLCELTRDPDIVSRLLSNALWNSMQKYQWLAELLAKRIKTVEKDFNIDDKDAKFFISLSKNATFGDTQLDDGLLRVSRLLYSYFNQTKIILLVDDYERIALQAFKNGDLNGVTFYEKLNKMLFQTLTKGSDYIKFAFISATGSLGFTTEAKKFNVFGFSFGRIKKPELFTHYPFLGNHVFTPYYGLTEEEVRSFCRSTMGMNIFEQILLNEAYLTVDKKRICNPASVSDYFLGVNRPRLYDGEKFSWIEPEFSRLLVPFSRSRVFREKMEDLDKYGYFQYPIKMTFSSNALKKLIELAQCDFKSITQSHVDMFFTFCFQQGYFTYLHGKNNFTFPNAPLRRLFSCQMKARESKSQFLHLVNLRSAWA